MKDAREASERAASLLIKNLDEQTSGQSKINYIVATVAAIIGGSKFDQKKHQVELLRLEYVAQHMMRRHSGETKHDPSPKLITTVDGFSLLLQLLAFENGEMLKGWLGNLSPWPPGPDLEAQHITDCDRARLILDSRAKDYHDAVMDGLRCRQKHSLPGGGMAPNPLFVDDPTGTAGPTTQGGSANNPCAAEQTIVEYALQKLNQAELDVLAAC